MESSSSKNLGYPLGYLFSLYTFCVFFSFPFILWRYGFYGLLGSNLLRYSTLTIDYYTSNATKYNMTILDKNGFDSKNILKMSIIRLLVGSFIIGSLFVYLFKGAESHFDLYLIRNVAISLAVTEIYFMIMHQTMHRYFPELHKLHHCCLRSSHTSNLFFGNMDIFLEFHLPLIIAYSFNVFLLNDTFTSIASIACIYTWYIMDHDEYIKLPHWYHHYYINSNYGAYSKSGAFDNKDALKKNILR